MKRLLLFLACVAICVGAPLSVDELVSKNREWRFITSLSYINILSKGFPSITVSVQNPQGGFTNISVISGAQNTNQDYLGFSLYGRYGLTKRVELFSTINAYWQNSLSTNTTNNAYVSTSQGDFNSWNLGVLVVAKKEGKAPALLVGGSVDIIDKSTFAPLNAGSSKSALQYGKGYSFFATTYYTADPVVFLLQASFGLNLDKHFAGRSINGGEVFSLSPSIYFAVNPYVSLNAGVSYQYRSADSINGVRYAPQGSSLGYNFGVAYEVASNVIIFGNAQMLETTQYKSSSLSLMLSFKI